MEYQETGRFGRITKNLRKQGFENVMDKILFDSTGFPKLKKVDQTSYVEKVMDRMEENIGLEDTNKVLFECGVSCCGKSWSNFAKGIWDKSSSTDEFFINLNKEEEKYNTIITYKSEDKTIQVERIKCICGLINKGKEFKENKTYCNCSLGHMSKFFGTLFTIGNIQLKKSIFSGDERCQWLIEIDN